MIELDQCYWNETKDEINGATAVFVIAQNSKNGSEKPIHVTVCNLGDSRCLVGFPKTREIRPMTEDHKPSSPMEQKRILEAGGIVTSGRIDAKLAVSRAVGDHQYKQKHDLPPDKQKVHRISSS